MLAVAALVTSPLAIPATADVTYSQNVKAVGEKKYVKKWTNYGPGVYYTFCGGRTGCVTAFQYWRVSRGTATVRMTTFKVTEKIRDFDYYLLDFDVTMSARSGTGDGGASTYRIKSTGPKLFDKNDSKTLKSDQGGCTDVAVTMSTPWPIVTASTTVGHAELCDKAATLTRSYSGADARYAGTKLAAMRHLTMQRWIKVKAGKKPSFDLGVVLPNDACTKGDGKGHCIKFDNKASSKAITINTTG